MNTVTEQAAVEAAPAAPTRQPTAAPYDASDVTLRTRLVEAGILIETGEDGLYGRSQVFEDVIDRLNHAITLLGADSMPKSCASRPPCAVTTSRTAST